MKIIISNTEFDYNTGCRLLKLIHKESPFTDLNDIWEDIEPLTFKEISSIRNLEQRRIAFLHYGLERLVKDVEPKLIDTKTIKKKTTWVNNKGEMVEKKFNDTYELFEVSGKHFEDAPTNRWSREPNNVYFVKCRCTSTDREYMIWVDLRSVAVTNGQGWNFDIKKVNAIQAIAWTIQTNVPEGNIEKIVRQGDCVLIKPIDKNNIDDGTRHLTEHEYRKLLVAES